MQMERVRIWWSINLENIQGLAEVQLIDFEIWLMITVHSPLLSSPCLKYKKKACNIAYGMF